MTKILALVGGLTLMMAGSALVGAEKKVDVTGKWSGTLESKKDDGDMKSDPAFMILKQEGNRLSGSGGPNEAEQHALQNGKVDGDKLTFEIVTEKLTLAFDLRTHGDQITGDLTGKKDGETRTAKISLKRVAEK